MHYISTFDKAKQDNLYKLKYKMSSKYTGQADQHINSP